MTEARVPLNIGLTNMLDRLGGNKSATLPELLNTVQPVIVYSDLSKSIASELFEARGQCYAAFPSIPATYQWVVLDAVSPGGLVIEEALFVSAAVIPTTGVTSILASVTNVLTAPFLFVQSGNFGGVPVQTVPGGGTSFPASPMTTPDFSSIPLPGTVFVGPVGYNYGSLVGRIFVPPGSQVMFASGPGATFQFFISWRELSDIAGG